VPISEPSMVAPQSGGCASGSMTSMSDIEVDPPSGPATPAYASGCVGRAPFPGPSVMASGYGVPTSGGQGFPPFVRGAQPSWAGQTVHVDEAGNQWVLVIPKPPSTEGSDLLSEQASEAARRDSSLVRAVEVLRQLFVTEGPLRLPPPPPPLARQSTYSMFSARPGPPLSSPATSGLPWSPRFLTSAECTDRVAQGGRWIPPSCDVEGHPPGCANLLRASHRWEARYVVVPGFTSSGVVRPSASYQLSSYG
jgi:hypothetical protein